MRAITDNDGLELTEFWELEDGLSSADREEIIRQALLVVEDLYAHRPVKAALFAQDPVTRLKNLRRQNRRQPLNELNFHYAILDIFTDMRDNHTRYVLPAPYQAFAAYLPFEIQEYFDDDNAHYLVSEILQATDAPGFTVGAEILTWNGVQIQQAIYHLEQITMGSNPAALRARAVSMMTLRHLAYMVVPQTSQVTLTYLDTDNQPQEYTFDWRIKRSSAVHDLFAADDRDPLEMIVSGVDPLLSAHQTVKADIKADTDMALTAVPADTHDWGETALPDNFAFCPIDTASGTFGYIKISSFEKKVMLPISLNAYIKHFLNEFIHIMEQLPQNGLIIDLRGNGGGVIPTGEGLIQLFSPRPVDTCRYQFLNTPATLQLTTIADDQYALSGWTDSIKLGLELNANYSQALPFLPFSDDYNNIGQRYYGPVVLLIDALCYSTTDMTIAAFADNNLGTIIGVDDNTGAGGANMWNLSQYASIINASTHDDTQKIPSLPGGASMSLALRRSIRTGQHSGQPIEDIGIIPDVIHRLTKNDIVHANQDLLNKAGEILASKPTCYLNGEIADRSDNAIALEVHSENLTSLDIYVNQRPVKTAVPVTDTITRIPDIPISSGDEPVQIRGYQNNTHMASRRIFLKSHTG